MIRPTGDRVLVALPPRADETVSAGGIVLVKDPERFYTPTRGIVVALGEKSGTVEIDAVLGLLSDANDVIALNAPDWSMSTLATWINGLRPARFDVEIGDCVLFPQSAGEELRQDGIDYVILREAEIIGILEPKASAA